VILVRSGVRGNDSPISLIETERFPDGMFVLVVDVQTDDFVLGPAVEREAIEVVARVVADADGRRGIGLPNMLEGGRTIRFPGDFIPRGVGELTL